MIPLDELVRYTDALLDVGAYSDYCPNGVQVEGGAEVHRIVSGVTACQALIDAAAAAGAELLLVHHGWFWRGEDARVVGMKRNRLKPLLAHDITLLAYHLPLDGHPELGNNARLGRLFGWESAGRFGEAGLALWAELDEPASLDALAGRVAGVLGRRPQVVAGSDRPVRRIGWCSGGAERYLAAAAALGLDAFLSGELSEPTAHVARELGIHYLAAGHHATERYGVQALGEHLADRFGLEHRFIDIDNPA